ncbi:Spore germination protein YndE [compost metagenome]|uniref:Spore gernimation protein n=1 Tax=Paenibacillus stellifer TaxID=169760 RepID=A0A089N6X8_9BACL|nr:GerAB/ArcD/ProY family transporter [Paenibacillus stellifer]AIQ64514.1 spore gernimation protein [Paenibacillus stellifer]
MFIRSDDKITSSQAAIFLTDSVLGAGILTLPRDVTEKVQTPDSWLSVLLGGVLVMLAILVMVKLSQQFPGKTVFEYSKKIVGTIPGSALSLLLILFFVMIAGFEIRVFAEVTLFFLLEGTPIWAIVIPFIWASVYLAAGGINAIARLFQIIFPISILILLLSLFLSVRIFDIQHLRPFLGEGLSPVIKGLKSSILVFSGCEVVLVLVGHLQHPEHAVKTMLAGLGIPLFLYFLTTVIVIGSMTIGSLQRSTWPTIDLLRSFEISGLFFERFEFPFLVIWMMQLFCNFTSFFYTASLGISQVFPVQYRTVLLALMPVIFIATLIPHTMNEIFELGSVIGMMSVLLFLLVTVPLSLIFLLRKKGLKRHG